MSSTSEHDMEELLALIVAQVVALLAQALVRAASRSMRLGVS